MAQVAVGGKADDRSPCDVVEIGALQSARGDLAPAAGFNSSSVSRSCITRTASECAPRAFALDRGEGFGTRRRLAGPAMPNTTGQGADNQQDPGIAISSNECACSVTTCVVTLQWLK
ncbi:hypothetical protein C7E18_09570 [Stenotrophomonas maltophilia]|nr:hypothetical protein C7E18_09570 [Stenotrophomonas maltophilia]